MKRLLIISPNFQPINAPDMQRVRMSLSHYQANGWEPVVMAVGERWQTGAVEPELLATIPNGIRVIPVPALPIGWSRWLGLGTLGLRALPFLWWRGTRLLRREKFDLAFFSNTQFITFTLGRFWLRTFGLPYVLDVQDPWRTGNYERPGAPQPPGGWKYQFARFLAWAFEGPSFAGAAAVMSVSPAYLSALSARYPGFGAKPSAVIRFGASLSDVLQARALPKPAHPFHRENGEIHIVYTGASGPIMPHALTALFRALRTYRTAQPELAGRLRLHFIGTSYAAAGQAKFSVLPLAVECGVGELVSEVPHRVGFLEALQLQQASDVLLLPGSIDPAYSPSKIYQYYLAGRPILGLVFRGSVMEGLLDELRCAFMVRLDPGGPSGEAHSSLLEFFGLAVAGALGASLPTRNESEFRRSFLAEELTRRQCGLFDEALASSARHARQ